MAYNYIRQVEVDGVNIPVGNYELATYSSQQASESYGLRIMGDSSECAVLRLRFVDTSGNFLNVDIPFGQDTAPNGTYRVRASSGNLNVESITYSKVPGDGTSSGAELCIRLNNIAAYLDAEINLPNTSVESITPEVYDTILSQTFTNDVLVEGLDYGTLSERPAAGNPGRIFFVKAEE